MAVPSATNPTHFYTRFRHKPLNPKVSLDSNENLMRLQTGVKLTSSGWSPAQNLAWVGVRCSVFACAHSVCAMLHAPLCREPLLHGWQLFLQLARRRRSTGPAASRRTQSTASAPPIFFRVFLVLPVPRKAPARAPAGEPSPMEKWSPAPAL